MAPKKPKLGRFGLGAGILAAAGLGAIAAREGSKLPEIEKCQADTNGAAHHVVDENPSAPLPHLPPELKSNIQLQIKATKEKTRLQEPPKITIHNAAEKIRNGNPQALLWLWQKADNDNGGTLDATHLSPLDIYLGSCDTENTHDEEEDEDFLEKYGISLTELNIATRASAMLQILKLLESPNNSDFRLGESRSWHTLARMLEIQGQSSNAFDPLFLQYLGKTKEEFQDIVRSICASYERYDKQNIMGIRYLSPINVDLLKQLYEIQ